MRYLKSILLMIFIVVIIGGCQDNKTEGDQAYDFSEMPKLRASVLEKNINPIGGQTNWDGEVLNIDILASYMKLVSGVDMPMVPEGEIIELHFEGPLPETIEIMEILRRPEGNRKYDDKTDVVIDVTYDDDGFYYFTVVDNWAVGLSSNTEDYKAENIYKGYEITCTWEDGQYEGVYGFVIHPDGNQFFN